MNLRLAVMSDLSQIIEMYKKIIAKMNDNGIHIWDEIYPCKYFKNDIENNQLYLLWDDDKIVSAFVLCDLNSNSKSVNWSDKNAKALYIERLGVNVDYLRRGIGLLTINKAMALAKEMSGEYLRLFVVDNNKAAINLYQKAGLKRAAGIYEEVIDDNLTLYELGFEIKIS